MAKKGLGGGFITATTWVAEAPTLGLLGLGTSMGKIRYLGWVNNLVNNGRAFGL